MHSILISPSMTKYMRTKFSGYDRWYRIFYNSVSLITLFPLIYSMKYISSTPIFKWDGFMVIFRFTLLLLAFILFREGSKKYDIGFFLGIRQLRTGRTNTLLSDEGLFAPTGVFGIIRHPWYAGSLLLVWSGLSEYSTATIITASVLSIYLVAGTFLEERKILMEYGEGYRLYQQHVSMLFPWKWIVRCFLGNR